MLHTYSVVRASVLLFIPGISMAKEKVINLSDRKNLVICSQLHFLLLYSGTVLLKVKLWPLQRLHEFLLFPYSLVCIFSFRAIVRVQV